MMSEYQTKIISQVSLQLFHPFSNGIDYLKVLLRPQLAPILFQSSKIFDYHTFIVLLLLAGNSFLLNY
jgi:hypothetical protein